MATTTPLLVTEFGEYYAEVEKSVVVYEYPALITTDNEIVGVSAFSESDNGFQFIFKNGERTSIGGAELDISKWEDKVIQ